MTIAQSINCLGSFLGIRDIPALTQAQLTALTGQPQADVMALFGGSILAGGDVLAQAMQAGVAHKYIIVGGEGHTTDTLRRRVHALYPDVDTTGLMEAEVFSLYLKRRWGVTPDALERRSTNCGNNITNMLTLLKQENIPCRSIILCQDATMQRRMAAGLRLHRPQMRIVNYAAYCAEAADMAAGPVLRGNINGMWPMEHYITLLLGEIPRLRDDTDGYGPQGKGFIAHEDIPSPVEDAFETLRAAYPHLVRSANPAWATRP